MNAATEDTKTDGMPKPAKMTRRDLERIIKACGLPNLSAVARAIGISRAHLYRLREGDTVINEAMAALIREKLPKKN